MQDKPIIEPVIETTIESSIKPTIESNTERIRETAKSLFGITTMFPQLISR